MVRIKHRYLLVNILYSDHPEPPHPKKSSSPLPATVPEILQFHRPSPDDLTPQLLVRTIREQIVYLYGDYGAGVANTGLLVKYLSPATSTFILRCSRAHHRIVWSALTFMTHLPVSFPSPLNPKQSLFPSNPSSSKQSYGKQSPASCVMHVVRVSGTIRKAEEEVVRRARGAIVRAEGGSGGVVEGGIFGGVGDGDEGGGGGGQERGGNEGERGMGLGMGIEDDDEEEDEDDDSMDEGG